MLTYLKIDNLALIEHSEVEFAPGFNVITGETGAGKSILLGAISLLLGDRADRTVIRSGAERCEICGIFRLDAATALEVMPKLAAVDIPFDQSTGELQLRRIITENAGRCHVNDVPVTARILREIGECLIDVHSANEHQSLTARSRQLELLDRYAHAEKLQSECAAFCEALQTLHREREAFAAGLPSAAEAGHLEMLIEEIEKVSPRPGEDDELTARHDLAAHSKQVMEDASALVNLLTDGEDSAADKLAQAYRLFGDLARIDETRGGELMNQCGVLAENIRELSGAVADFGGSVELDEAAFLELENRLSALYTLKRRYGPALDQVIATLDDARVRLEAYRGGNRKRKEFDAREAELRKQLQSKADELTALRRAEAAKMAAEVRAKLGAIGFAAGALEPEFTRCEPGANGQDVLELLFSANPGETPQPLRKIASSGELSRLMLAMKTVLSDADRVPVAVFDEIDVNIGGETAARVGEELHKLGMRRQLLAISHLPQVAARGDAHFAVSKAARDARTVSTIRALDRAGRETEIARMLGGGKAAGLHAREILDARG